MEGTSLNFKSVDPEKKPKMILVSSCIEFPLCEEWQSREGILISVYDVDALAVLDQLSIPVPTAWDIAWVDLTVQFERLTQQQRYILQVLVDLQWFH